MCFNSTKNILKPSTWVPLSAAKVGLILNRKWVWFYQTRWFNSDGRPFFWSVICLRSEIRGKDQYQLTAAASCNPYLLLISRWSQQVQNKHAQEGEADTCWQHHHSATTISSIHFFSEDTATIIQRAKRPLRYTGINYKALPIQHDDVGLIYHSFLISAFKTHEDNAHF